MTAFTWTNNASGNENWNDQQNWNGGAAGYPDGDDDTATFDGTWDNDCTMNEAITVGEVNLSAGYASIVTLAEKLIIDDNSLSGDLNLAAGTLDADGFDIDIDGIWNNTGGTFTHADGKVTLTGVTQTINGDNHFFDIQKSITSAETLTIEAAKTVEVSGTITFNGASGELLSLVSGTPSTAWKLDINASGTKAMSFLDVTDGDATTSHVTQIAINPTNSTDSARNVKFFSGLVTTVSSADHIAVIAAIEAIDDTKYIRSIVVDGKVQIYHNR